MDEFRLRLKPYNTLIAAFLVAGFLGLFTRPVAAQDEPSKDQPATLKSAEGVTPKASLREQSSEGGTASSLRPRGYQVNGRRRGALRRPLSAQDIQNVIAVANDVSPDWAESLKKLHEEDSESLTESIRKNGRRLLGLAMLRERDPALYEVRVGELRCNRELSAVSVAYKEAIRDGRNEDAEELREQVRVLVKQSLDFELRARAMELAALDKALRELKSQLQVEIATQNDRLQQRLNEVLAVEPPTELSTESVED